MSSKNRRNRGQNQRRNQHPNRRPGSGGPSPLPSPSRRGANAKTWVILAVLLVAGLIVYARIGPKPGTSRIVTAVDKATAPSVPPAASPARSISAGPRIEFARTVYDFGKVNGDELVNCEFVFTNTGNALLELSEVTPACGCMKIGQWSRKAEPGQTGTINVQYDSHHYTGPFGKSVFLTCNDSNQPKPILEIKGLVWRPVEINPPYATIELNAEVPSNAVTVRIRSNLDQPLTITNLQADNPAFAAELQTNQPGKEYQLLVKTTPPFPTISQQGHITLKTTATNMPEISINARANLLPLVMPIPYLVRLPPAPLTNPFPYKVWVRNNSTNAITLSEATVSVPGVEVQIQEEQPGKQFALSLVFPAGFHVGPGEQPQVSVKTSHPQVPIIKLPVLQPSSAAAPAN